MNPMQDALTELLQEQAATDALLSPLAADAWLTPTPSDGWDVRDTVSHLSDTNEIAIDTMLGGPRSLNEAAKGYDSPEAFTLSGCLRGRSMSPADVLAWWRRSSEAMNETFLSMDPKQRIPWGLGMTARTLVTARLMEHWAHAVDLRRTLGAPIALEPRLRSIAWLITNAIPYAFTIAETPVPAGHTLRVALSAAGETWEVGPSDATDSITGDALEYCLLGVQRTTRADTSLVADGPYADLALDRLRAYL